MPAASVELTAVKDTKAKSSPASDASDLRRSTPRLPDRSVPTSPPSKESATATGAGGRMVGVPVPVVVAEAPADALPVREAVPLLVGVGLTVGDGERLAVAVCKNAQWH